MARAKKKLGQILIDAGAITAEQLETGLSMAKGAGKRLGEALVDADMIDDTQLAKAIAKQSSLDYVDVAAPDFADKVAGELLPKDLIRKHLVLPIGKARGRLHLVVHDPRDIQLLDMLRFRLNLFAGFRSPH